MNGLSLVRTSFLRILDMVDKFDMGRKLLKSETSVPGFLRRCMTCAMFMTYGNLPATKDELVREESKCEKFT